MKTLDDLLAGAGQDTPNPPNLLEVQRLIREAWETAEKQGPEKSYRAGYNQGYEKGWLEGYEEAVAIYEPFT